MTRSAATFDRRSDDVALPASVSSSSSDVTEKGGGQGAESLFKSICSTAGATDKEGQEEFLTSYTCCPPPLFIPVITLVQVVVFVVYAVDMSHRGQRTDISQGFPHYSPLYYKPTKRHEAWRFVTYMFVHNGYGHIVSNVLMQVLFGLPMEMVHGWWRVAIIYLTGVTAGSLTCSVLDHETSVVGASGGCFAIVGAHIAAVIINWREMNYKLIDDSRMNVLYQAIRILFSAFVRLTIAGTIVILETTRAIVVRYRGGTAEENVTFLAHIGGLLAGLFLGIRLLKNVHALLWESVLGVVTLVASLLLFAFAVLFNVFYRGYPPTDWS